MVNVKKKIHQYLQTTHGFDVSQLCYLLTALTQMWD